MRIGVIAAMRAELDALTGMLESPGTVTKAGFAFHTGVLGGRDAVLVLSGIGKVNAAVGTALLIEDFAPDAVVNTGVAGGFSPAIRVGDIVLSEEVRHHDVDVVCFGYEYGQVPGMPPAYRADGALLRAARAARPADPGVAVHSGLIVSGDRFLGHEDAEAVLSRFPGALAGEMEAAAVAQACGLFGTPFLVTRSISDIVTEEGNKTVFDEFLPVAARNSAAFVIDMLSRIEEET